MSSWKPRPKVVAGTLMGVFTMGAALDMSRLPTWAVVGITVALTQATAYVKRDDPPEK